MSSKQFRDHLLTEKAGDSEQHQADFPEAPQCDNEPTFLSDDNSRDSIPDHPASFSFPTLGSDGSIDDLSALSIRAHPPTPPAALSSLGAKTRDSMADQDPMTDSTSSFADSQYDMVDDLSEISNDDHDHDTASLASTEHGASEDGVLTPEEAADAADEQEEPSGGDEQELAELARSITDSGSETNEEPHGTLRRSTLRPGSTSSEQWQKVGEENEALDSYLSEDLETPRQSTVRGFAPSTRQTQMTKASALSLHSQTASREPLRLLFIADCDLPEAAKSQFCAKITSALAGSPDPSRCRASILPLTPSGISPSSVILYRDGDVEVAVQHCIGIEPRDEPYYSSTPFQLQILDVDGDHSSVYKVGQGTKPELSLPDMAVIYTPGNRSPEPWLATAGNTMAQLKVPTVMIDDQSANARHANTWTSDEILDVDGPRLRDRLHKLLDGKVAGIRSPSKPKSRIWSLAAMSSTTPLIAAMLLLLGLSMLRQNWASLFADPAAQADLRRDTLSSRFATNTNVSDATKTLNVDHLVPQPSVTGVDMFGRKLYDVQTELRYDVVPPCHVVVSLPQDPKNRAFPNIKSLRARRADRYLDVIHAKLADGIYDSVIYAREAHGLVTYEAETNKGDFTIRHNFGNKMLQRQTYEKARTDISKSVTKDISVARKTVNSLRELVQLELSAGAAATKNVATQLAVQMTRDLQIVGKTAASIEKKLDEVFDSTARAIVKDLAVVQRDIARMGKSLRQSMVATTKSVKAAVPNAKTAVDPLRLARERAVGFRRKLLGGRKPANSTSTTKELSVRVQDFVKSLSLTKPWPTLRSSKKVTNSLSTVPGQGLTSKKTCNKGRSARDAKARSETKRERALWRANGDVKDMEVKKAQLEKRIAEQSAKSEKVLQKARDKAAKLKHV